VMVLRRPSVDAQTPASGQSTGGRRVSSTGGTSVLRTTTALAGPFAPRALSLLPRPAPRMSRTPAPRAVPVIPAQPAEPARSPQR
jgi:hypothetical protein